jgi:hypothetical protein
MMFWENFKKPSGFMKEPAKNWWVRIQGKFLHHFPEFLRFMVRSWLILWFLRTFGQGSVTHCFDCLTITGQGYIYQTLIHKVLFFFFFFLEREMQNMNISLLVCPWTSAGSGYNKDSRVSKLKVLSFFGIVIGI